MTGTASVPARASLRKDGAPPFARILIANRGEIAVRIIRTCQALGVETVAVYSDADAGALHVQLADASVRLGPAPAADSYLRADRIIEAARATGAEAIHPGYGFLSERASFARSVVDAGRCLRLPFSASRLSSSTTMFSDRSCLLRRTRSGIETPGFARTTVRTSSSLLFTG